MIHLHPHAARRCFLQQPHHTPNFPHCLHSSQHSSHTSAHTAHGFLSQLFLSLITPLPPSTVPLPPSPLIVLSLSPPSLCSLSPHPSPLHTLSPHCRLPTHPSSHLTPPIPHCPFSCHSPHLSAISPLSASSVSLFQKTVGQMQGEEGFGGMWDKCRLLGIAQYSDMIDIDQVG